MQLLQGDTPKQKYDNLKLMLEALTEAEETLSHEYWMTGEAATVIRAAIDKNPTIIKIRALLPKKETKTK